MINRFFYKASLNDFVAQPYKTILGTISDNNVDDTKGAQNATWKTEIETMKSVINDLNVEEGEIVFEYTIPRLGKRIDVVLLLQGIIFVLEFKDGADIYLSQDFDQTVDYALDLKYFHKPSNNRIIVPILICTEASEDYENNDFKKAEDCVYNPIGTNAENLSLIIQKILKKEHGQKADLSDWVIGRYAPTPTIIEAASALYNNHTVEDITKTEADGASLERTTKFVLDIIKRSKSKNEKSICFVTGVPGAGKTLVGLNVAIEQSNLDNAKERNLAVYLSGNGPLVKVLTESLARDKKQKDGCKLDDAKREVGQFIQSIHHYRDNMLGKIKLPIENGKIKIDQTKSKAEGLSGHGEVEHVAIFDEAQRSWTLEHISTWLKRGGSRGNKKKVENFPMSESEFLIWSMNLRKDWSVIVCLVGGGQEINSGEAGIMEWIKAVDAHFKDWKVYISSQLKEKEYSNGDINKMLKNNKNVQFNDQLHLAVSMRSFRAEKLSDFVHALLSLDKATSKKLYKELDNRSKDNPNRHFPIVLTRDIEKAKSWLRNKARGNERYGIVVSSKAMRLKPLSIDVRLKPDVVHWFLDDKNDVRSSLYLEDAASEFDVQGLELDWTCVVWDGDFRFAGKEWNHHEFVGTKWNNINKIENQEYQLNAYRVLLTRARQGMVICVPEGDENDPTRLPEFYDSTYLYLKSLGIEIL